MIKMIIKIALKVSHNVKTNGKKKEKKTLQVANGAKLTKRKQRKSGEINSR